MWSGQYCPLHSRIPRVFLPISKMMRSPMSPYLTRRLLLILPTLFILSILVFLSVRFIPGDVIDVMVSELEYYTISV